MSKKLRWPVVHLLINVHLLHLPEFTYG